MIQAWRRLSVHPVMRPLTEWRVYRTWDRAGRPVPAPPMVKQRILKQALRRHGLGVVVETGSRDVLPVPMREWQVFAEASISI